MRKDLVYVGGALLVVGVVVFGMSLAGAAAATTNFMNCMAGSPPLTPTLPNACTDALNALAMYGTLEGVGGMLGLVGFVLLLVGLILEPARPVSTPFPGYPPPAWAPPPTYPAAGAAPPPPPRP